MKKARPDPKREFFALSGPVFRNTWREVFFFPIVGVPLVLLVALALPLVPRLGVAGPLARV